MRYLALTFLLAALGGPKHAGLSDPQNWERADAETIRLKPSAFTDLPGHIREDLERRGCTVPQSYAKRTPHNVVRGHFTSAAQMDIAVLCSKARSSSILVFAGGSNTSVRELAAQRDADALQTIGPGDAIGYSRSLAGASPKYIREHYDRYGGPTPPPLDHDGLDDGFDGKGSVVWYWYGEKWLRLTGAN
jgi:hypothetical protein